MNTVIRSIISLIVISLMFIGCGSVPPDSGTVNTESALLPDSGSKEVTCLFPSHITCSGNTNQSEINYWYQYCSKVVKPISNEVCVGSPSVNVRECTCAYANTFPICSLSAAKQYLACVLHDTGNFDCQDGGANLLPWVAYIGSQCLDIENVAFGC